MERLTQWEDGGLVSIKAGWTNYAVAARLAAYEDTGLAPEQVMELKSFIQGGIHKVDDGWKHVQELLHAEQDGRLVVLPCKAGDVVYDIYEAKENGEGVIYPLKVTDIHIHVDKRGKAFFIVDGYYFSLSDFGKTVFLTREEAEAALAQKGGEG